MLLTILIVVWALLLFPAAILAGVRSARYNATVAVYDGDQWPPLVAFIFGGLGWPMWFAAVVLYRIGCWVSDALERLAGTDKIADKKKIVALECDVLHAGSPLATANIKALDDYRAEQKHERLTREG